jgi:hypothetical protein
MPSRVILIIGAVIIVLMLLFPPFHEEFKGVVVNLGYHFILDRPADSLGRVDAVTLLIQFVGVGLVTMLLWLAFKK